MFHEEWILRTQFFQNIILVLESVSKIALPPLILKRELINWANPLSTLQSHFNYLDYLFVVANCTELKLMIAGYSLNIQKLLFPCPQWGCDQYNSRIMLTSCLINSVGRCNASKMLCDCFQCCASSQSACDTFACNVSHHYMLINAYSMRSLATLLC